MVQCPVGVVGRVSDCVAGHYVYGVIIPYVCIKISVLRSWRWALVCPKHVELILKINKNVIAASSWFPYLLYLHISCSITFFSFENRVIYEIMWKNILEPGRTQIRICYMCIACWIPKATNTHSDYIILIAYPIQTLLREGASILHYTYTACLLCNKTN
jgi:hypothetical protein